MAKKKRVFLPIPWLEENSTKNLAENALMAKFFADDGHPEAVVFLENLKVKHIDALLTYGFCLIGLEDYGPRGYCEDMIKFWLSEAGVNDLN